MRLSNKSMMIEPSLTRRLYDMARQYQGVIDLTLGDPDMKPDTLIRQAAIDAITEGKTRYSANAGLAEVRKKVAEAFEEEYGMKILPETDVIMTVGGMEALYLALLAIINPGDEVIIHAPYYVNYVQMVQMCGGIPVLIETTEESRFSFTAEEVCEKISSKTVAMILNTPCNPTGQMLGTELLNDLAELFCEKDIYVISDEVYRALVFEGRHESIVTRPGMRERTLVVDSMSKRFAMTGYRIGYAIGNEEWISAMVKMQENVVACAPLSSQYATIAALRECRDNEDLKSVFEERVRAMEEALNKSCVLHCVPHAATFYLFVNIQKTGMTSLEFAYKLLEKEQVAVAPGIVYGKAYDFYVRIACTVDKATLLEAANKIIRFAEVVGE